MFVLARALTYAALFVAFVLVFLPTRVLSWAGVGRPTHIGGVEIAGLVLTAGGAFVAVWCVIAFIHFGRGTPAPFDPPRRLVVEGPYRYLRNPMYAGAAIALAGAALFFRSSALLAFDGLFVLITHLFVVLYEEPTLRRLFGAEYDAYRETVGRWLPPLRRPHPDPPGVVKR